MIEAHACEKANEAYLNFMNNHTQAEMAVVGHLIRSDFRNMVEFMKEMRRLLDESLAQCKVIPFPVMSKVERAVQEIIDSLNHPQKPQSPELTIVPKRKQGRIHRENKRRVGSANKNAKPNLKRKAEVSLDDPIH